ncbi:MAG TPA: orotidine-5'-phosphate decarboxylase [Candidatus Saccharimonadia bacterium]
MEFKTKLSSAVQQNDTLLCVGLDPVRDNLPDHLKNHGNAFFTFNKAIIDATADLICAFKPNSAFYEAEGADGISQLHDTCRYITDNHPHIPIILDFKRADIGSTNQAYSKFAFDYLGVDAITVHPYLGRDAIQPFLDYKDKGIMILVRTSNPGSGEFQNLEVDGVKLYLKVAKAVQDSWNANQNCQLVIGATYPEELAEIRKLVGDDMIFLVPGIGAQGGQTDLLRGGFTKNGDGLIISSSRETIYASGGENFADAARAKATELRDQINSYR